MVIEEVITVGQAGLNEWKKPDYTAPCLAKAVLLTMLPVKDFLVG